MRAAEKCRGWSLFTVSKVVRFNMEGWRIGTVSEYRRDNQMCNPDFAVD